MCYSNIAGWLPVREMAGSGKERQQMSKYVVIGGFLGAGKTTSMMALADVLKKQGKTPAILVNDPGAKNLVDGKFTEANGYLSLDITGDCICYQTENLVDRLRRFRDAEHADIIFSDIPGCGIGALDHVYHKLDQEYHGEFSLCPFVAIVDPARLRVVMPEPVRSRSVTVPALLLYMALPLKLTANLPFCWL